MTNSTTLAESLANAISEVSKVNGSVQVKPAAVLWPDKDGIWLRVIPALRKLLPGLCILGPYEPESASGPAIWLKCAVAGVLPKTNHQGIPVVYLPGVSRAELRAIEDCSRNLQPLAELQYRGVFWSQANTKDWTLSAFLSSKNGGLNLDVAQDKSTQEALGQALEAGVLLERTVEELKGRQINAEWLHGLLAPNPTRDLLVWMNDPDAAKKQWVGVRWDVFVTRCKTDFGVDPVADGVLVAAELLTKGAGKWTAVSELYRDSYASFPNVFGLLAKVPPPQLGLFPDLNQLSGYPQANEEREAALRYALFACSDMDAVQARNAILNAEKDHAVRRNWLWSRMGFSSLARALGHIARVAELSLVLPSGATPAQLASSYQQTGWQVDDAAIQALASVHAKHDVEAVATALRAVYLPWLHEAAHRFQEAVKSVGGLPPLVNIEGSDTAMSGLCTVFVDGLRYDVAVHLKHRLENLGKTAMSACWTSMPSVTASGKAWCSPVAKLVAGDKEDADFEPRVASNGKPLSGYNFRKLLTENGVQPLDKHELGDPQGRAWTESGDLDHYGHEHGIRLARDLNSQLDQVMDRLTELSQAGWRRFRIVTDHGWLLMPGGLPKTELPKHQAETRWGRCAVLKDTSDGTPLTFGWDWCKDVQVAYAPGVSCFVAGEEYAHGGISLQECLVPVLSLEMTSDVAPALKIAITAVTWKGLRCVVEVDSAASGLTVDIRTKPALASTSLVANIKAVESGKASLAVADDEHAGSAAIVVVLGLNGEVLQKVATTVGG
jgi:hypothetical protein